MRVLVHGAGLMGRAIVDDLLGDGATVTVNDVDEDALSACREAVSGEIETVTVDVTALDDVSAFISDEEFDVVINALPHELSIPALNGAIEAGVDAIDLAFEEDQLDLDEAATDAGVTVIPGGGVAPGLSNMLTGDGIDRFDDPTDVSIKVGGIPADPAPPLEYRVVFHLDSVWNAYQRPVRVIEDGELTRVEALSGVEPIEFDGVGELECFLTDGLGTLPHTFDDVPNMEEKTIRYPDHALKARTLRECGLLDETPIDVDGASVSPRAVLTEVLAPKLSLDDEHDLTVMRVEVEGTLDGDCDRYEATLVDRYDEDTDTTSMARTTGYTATAVARLLVDGKIDEEGIVPPELLGTDRELFDRVLTELADRDVVVDRTIPTRD